MAPPPTMMTPSQPSYFDPTRGGSSDPYGQHPQHPPAPTTFMTPSAPMSHSAPPPADNYIPDQGGPGHLPPTSSGPGWNDPPPMALMSKPKTTAASVTTTSSVPSEPITQPLMGGAPVPDPYSSAPPLPSSYGGYGAPPDSMFGQTNMAQPPPANSSSMMSHPPSQNNMWAPAPVGGNQGRL